MISNNRYSLVEVLQRSIPTVLETELDSKKVMEQKLKKSCEGFIHAQTTLHIGPLLRLLEGKPLKRRRPSRPKAAAAATPPTGGGGEDEKKKVEIKVVKVP